MCMGNGTEDAVTFFVVVPSYLQSTADSTIFDGEAVLSILEGVAENSDGYQVAWDFVRGNWGKVRAM